MFISFFESNWTWNKIIRNISMSVMIIHSQHTRRWIITSWDKVPLLLFPLTTWVTTTNLVLTCSALSYASNRYANFQYFFYHQSLIMHFYILTLHAFFFSFFLFNALLSTQHKHDGATQNWYTLNYFLPQTVSTGVSFLFFLPFSLPFSAILITHYKALFMERIISLRSFFPLLQIMI